METLSDESIPNVKGTIGRLRPNSLWAWLLTFSNLESYLVYLWFISRMIKKILTDDAYHPSRNAGTDLMLVSFGLIFLFVYLDRGQLRKAGLPEPQIPSQWWFLFPLVYLFKRARRLGNNQVMFWLMIVQGIICLILQNPIQDLSEYGVLSNQLQQQQQQQQQ